MPGFKQDEHEPQGQQDHGRPTHQVTWTGAHGRPCKDWVYCPVCLTVKDGWFKNGTPRFSGGIILIQYQLENGAKRTFRAACSCEHGLRKQDQAERIHQMPNAMLPFRSYRIGQQIKTSSGSPAEIVDILIPGEGSGVKTWRIGDGQASPDAQIPVPAPTRPVAGQTGGKWGSGASGPDLGPQGAILEGPDDDEVDEYLPF